jgi:hypothetical protein
MTIAKIETIEEDVTSYIKNSMKFLISFLNFPDDLDQNIDKIICFHISDSRISDDAICCFLYTEDTLEELIEKMERIVNIRAFL